MIEPIGSTKPDNTPYTKVFHFGIPSALNGIDTIAPSGKFWIAIPRAKASAPKYVMELFSFNQLHRQHRLPFLLEYYVVLPQESTS